MTNSEAIEILKMERIFRNGSNSKVEAIDIAISALEENTKLKAEIEQLKWKLSSVETQRDLKGYDAKRNVDIMSSQLKIIEQLKENRRYISEVNGSLVRINDRQDREIAKLKDEIEQLKLELEKSVKLPCKVGDKAWCITSDQYDYITEPIECTVNEISINIDNPSLLLFRIDSNNSTDGCTDTFPDMRIPNHMNIRRIDDFGKTVFLTREEAEHALKSEVSE